MFNQIRGVYISSLHQFHYVCAVNPVRPFSVQVGLFGRSGWIPFPGSVSVVKLGLYNKNTFQDGFQVPERYPPKAGGESVFRV